MKKGVTSRSIIQALMLLLAMFCGVLIGKLQLPPYSIVESAYTMLVPPDPAERSADYSFASAKGSTEYMEAQSDYYETDVAALISIDEASDVFKLRKQLIYFLWGESGLPRSLPSDVEKNLKDRRYQDILSLERIDKITISMEFGLKSIVYHFIPKKSNNKVILYHQGHDGDFIQSKEQINYFIDKGYAVIAFCMPLLGLNNQPIVYFSRIGQLKITSHDHMKFLKTRGSHPIKYFIEPVVIALNYLESDLDYSQVSMVGISGGGWTTTLAAALDARISYSFPVAGSYPLYLRSDSPRDWGDYEQNNPELYKTVNYLELYIMGGHGKNRKQTQVINLYDPCCFSGIKWETYEEVVKSRVDQLGDGGFEILLDDSHHEHRISRMVIDRILDQISSD